MVTTPFDQRTREFTQPAGSAQLCVSTTVYNPGKYVLVSTTVAGTQVLTMSDGTTCTPSFPIGVVCLPLAITGYTTGTGTATVYIMF